MPHFETSFDLWQSAVPARFRNVNAPIFISYSSSDQKVAEIICDALQARGCACWIACRDIREHPADDVFVDIDAKGTRNLLCDAGTTNTGIAALELDDRVDEFLRWPFWSGAPMTSRREKPPVFAFLERLVESQQGSGLQDDRELRD